MFEELVKQKTAEAAEIANKWRILRPALDNPSALIAQKAAEGRLLKLKRLLELYFAEKAIYLSQEGPSDVYYENNLKRIKMLIDTLLDIPHWECCTNCDRWYDANKQGGMFEGFWYCSRECYRADRLTDFYGDEAPKIRLHILNAFLRNNPQIGDICRFYGFIYPVETNSIRSVENHYRIDHIGPITEFDYKHEIRYIIFFSNQPYGPLGYYNIPASAIIFEVVEDRLVLCAYLNGPETAHVEYFEFINIKDIHPGVGQIRWNLRNYLEAAVCDVRNHWPRFVRSYNWTNTNWDKLNLPDVMEFHERSMEVITEWKRGISTTIQQSARDLPDSLDIPVPDLANDMVDAMAAASGVRAEIINGTQPGRIPPSEPSRHVLTGYTYSASGELLGTHSIPVPPSEPSRSYRYTDFGLLGPQPQLTGYLYSADGELLEGPPSREHYERVIAEMAAESGLSQEQLRRMDQQQLKRVVEMLEAAKANLNKGIKKPEAANHEADL